MTDDLVKRFHELKRKRQYAIQERQARMTLGPSIMRVFAEKTSEAVRPVLEKIPLDTLRRVTSQRQYQRWFERQLDHLTAAVLTLNAKNRRIQPGVKWGHCAKILNAFMQGIVRQSRYFDDRESKRLESWLYVPLDSYVMRELRACGIYTPNRINEIADKAKFYQLQDVMGAAATEVSAPRILFDDVWSCDRRNGIAGVRT